MTKKIMPMTSRYSIIGLLRTFMGARKTLATSTSMMRKKPDVERVLSRKVKGFEGAESKGTLGSRTRPVEFERHDDGLFGMDGFLNPSKKVKKE